ncbi:MAG: methyltransferase domain-containing protein [Deltaproteobacteria bacterium]|nr:methyltransferase domain-containing protein [Deltaproteobacteria bacterium]
MTQKKKHRRGGLTARTADRHVLYQLSVQDTEHEARFLDRVYRKVNGRPPRTLREDFCGTALLCAEWVQREGRRAVGVDLDPAVLAWGKEHNIAPLGDAARRVDLREADVRSRVPGRFDVSVALNFSYFVFRDRATLREYFASVRRTLAPDGLFFLDAYGGHESLRPLEEPRRVKGFTYVWDQASIDPIDHSVVNHIHFRFPDGTELRRAFTYEWRLWSLPEIRELLAEAGFSSSEVYWEDGDDDGNGTGVFRPRKRVAQEAAWVAYIVARR